MKNLKIIEFVFQSLGDVLVLFFVAAFPQISGQRESNPSRYKLHGISGAIFLF